MDSDLDYVLMYLNVVMYFKWACSGQNYIVSLDMSGLPIY